MARRMFEVLTVILISTTAAAERGTILLSPQDSQSFYKIFNGLMSVTPIPDPTKGLVLLVRHEYGSEELPLHILCVNQFAWNGYESSQCKITYDPTKSQDELKVFAEKPYALVAEFTNKYTVVTINRNLVSRPYISDEQVEFLHHHFPRLWIECLPQTSDPITVKSCRIEAMGD